MAKNKGDKIEYIKFRYRNVERKWLKVKRETDKSYVGPVANDPTEPGLNFGDKRRVLQTEIYDIMYKK